MLTTYFCHTCETDEMMTLLGVKMYGSVVTLHLKTPARASIPKNHDLNKFEIDQFIERYPPFYRQSFETTGGIKLGPPILHSDGIGRGSWVFVVGMSNSIGKPCGVHNMQRVTQEKEGAFWTGTLVPTAFKMIKRTLLLIKAYELEHRPAMTPTDSLKGASPSQTWSSKALKCYDTMISDEYSRLPWQLKIQQIGAFAFFEGVVGNCPCKYSCIGDNPHAE